MDQSAAWLGMADSNRRRSGFKGRHVSRYVNPHRSGDGTAARYRAVVWTVRVSRSAFNLQRHSKWTAEVDSHNPVSLCRRAPELLGHRRKMAQPDGVEPPSSDLESEALATNTKAVLKLVVRVGLAPTVFLVWRLYRPLRSLLSHLTIEIGWSDGIRTRVSRIKSSLQDHFATLQLRSIELVPRPGHDPGTRRLWTPLDESHVRFRCRRSL